MQVGEFLERSGATLKKHFRTEEQRLSSGHLSTKILARVFYRTAMNIRRTLILRDFKTELGKDTKRALGNIDSLRIHNSIRIFFSEDKDQDIIGRMRALVNEALHPEAEGSD